MSDQVVPVPFSAAASILEAIVSTANEDPVVGRMLAGWDRDVAVHIDGVPFTVRTRDGHASLIADAVVSSTLSFTLNFGTLELLRDGRITPLAAKLKGLIRSTGSIVDILRFSSLLSSCVRRMAARQTG